MSENQKLREALQHAIEDLSSATGFLTRRSRDRQSKTVAALAQLQADIALPTAVPVGEREAFERTMMDKYGWQHEDFKLDDFGYADGQTDTAWMAWQARAALSAGDAVDAQRLDFIEKSARCDPKMDGQHVWWPTSLNKALKGPTLRAAIDAAMRKDKL